MWNARSPNMKTYLGVMRLPSCLMMGVVKFEVTDAQLAHLDARESTYDRVAVDPEDVTRSPKNAQYWIYVPKPEWTFSDPSAQYAAKLSYIDTIVLACIEIGDDFAQLFLMATSPWDELYWFNNRKITGEDAKRVDALIGDLLQKEKEVTQRLPLRS